MSTEQPEPAHPSALDTDLLNVLSHLQAAEDRLREAREESAHLPDRLNLRTKKLNEVTSEFDQSALLLQDTQKMIDAKNVDASSIETSIENSKEQILALTDAKHVDAMNHQIDGQREKLSECQDAILELMMAQDDLTPPHEALTEKKSGLEAEVAELAGHVDKRGAELVSEISELESARAESATHVDASVLTLFDAAANTDDRRGLAVVENEICQGCDTRLTPQLSSDVINAHFVLCPHCDRILYKSN